MTVFNKEYYTQLDGAEVIKAILKPTKVFPQGGYFYAPREAEELVDSYCWCLNKNKRRVRITAHSGSYNEVSNLAFHKALFKFYRGFDWQEDIDHLNMIEFDNVDNNLNAVTSQQNKLNKFSRGYTCCSKNNCFRAIYVLNWKTYYPFSVIHNEVEACKQANMIDKVILKESLGDQYYRFDFLKYRRGSEDILDLERTGVISEEEATYQHILRYSTNAWYYLRFGLQDYFKEHNIPTPKYDLDENGFMVHPITGQKLCPF